MHATDLGDKYPYLFQVAAYHTQHPNDRNLLCQYPIHKDKAGKITAFYCVEGWSFNFIAVQCKNGKQKKSKFVEDDAYEQYKMFKQQYVDDEHYWKKILNFEKVLIDEMELRTIIQVIWLQKGQYIIFNAQMYLHGTIVPKQSEQRSLLIFHDLKKNKM